MKPKFQTYKQSPMTAQPEVQPISRKKLSKTKKHNPKTKQVFFVLSFYTFIYSFLQAQVTVTETSFALPRAVCLVLVKPQIFERGVSSVDVYSFKFCKHMEMVLHEEV